MHPFATYPRQSKGQKSIHSTPNSKFYIEKLTPQTDASMRAHLFLDLAIAKQNGTSPAMNILAYDDRLHSDKPNQDGKVSTKKTLATTAQQIYEELTVSNQATRLQTVQPQIEALFALLKGYLSLNDPSTIKETKNGMTKGERLAQKFTVPEGGYDHYFAKQSLFKKNELGEMPHIQYGMATLNFIYNQLSAQDRLEMQWLKSSILFSSNSDVHDDYSLPKKVEELQRHHKSPTSDSGSDTDFDHFFSSYDIYDATDDGNSSDGECSSTFDPIASKIFDWNCFARHKDAPQPPDLDMHNIDLMYDNSHEALEFYDLESDDEPIHASHELKKALPLSINAHVAPPNSRRRTQVQNHRPASRYTIKFNPAQLPKFS